MDNFTFNFTYTLRAQVVPFIEGYGLDEVCSIPGTAPHPNQLTNHIHLM
jgi:hypothetical protein